MKLFALYLRSTLFFIIVTLFTIVWGTLCVSIVFLPFRARYFITSRWNISVLWLAKVICGIHLHIKGVENIPTRSVVIASKHQSAWETIFFIVLMRQPIAYVLKRSLLFIPFFGWALGLLHMIAIDRKSRNAFDKVVIQGRKCLEDGQSVVIFPEGTRIKPGQRGVYKHGAARLAMATAVPVLPVALNAGEYWPKNSFLKYPGTITISIGPVIDSKVENAVDLTRAVEHWIENEMMTISPHLYSELAQAA